MPIFNQAEISTTIARTMQVREEIELKLSARFGRLSESSVAKLPMLRKSDNLRRSKTLDISCGIRKYETEDFLSLGSFNRKSKI
jgi:hypothetical protein